SSLDEYQNFEGRVRALAGRVNARFGRGGWEPIRLKVEHHEAPVVNEYYRAADVCVVTSLHDGMNLVAKEFIASRDDEQGVLVLSQFTGAARELHDALLVNPYHSEQCAHALYRALTMPADEQRVRMRSVLRWRSSPDAPSRTRGRCSASPRATSSAITAPRACPASRKPRRTAPASAGRGSTSSPPQPRRGARSQVSCSKIRPTR